MAARSSAIKIHSAMIPTMENTQISYNSQRQEPSKANLRILDTSTVYIATAYIQEARIGNIEKMF